VTRSWPDQSGKSCPRLPSGARRNAPERLASSPSNRNHHLPTTRATMAGVPPRAPTARVLGSLPGDLRLAASAARSTWGAIGGVVRTVLSVDDSALFRPAARGCRRLGAERAMRSSGDRGRSGRGPGPAVLEGLDRPLVSTAGAGPLGR
jgi:hypothetical protein